MPRFVVVLLVVVASGAGLACPSVSSSEDDDDDGGEGGRGGSVAVATFGESACGECVDDACADAVRRCESEPECVTHLGCVRACPVAPSGDVDPACEAACPSPAEAAAIAARDALSNCRTIGAGASCASCGRTPAVHPLIGQTCDPPTAVDACARCEEEFCCGTRCDAACDTYVNCIRGCGEQPACEDACASDNPAGVTSAGRWLGCQTIHCQVCGGIVAVEPLAECAFSECANEFAACFDNPSCFLRWVCGRTCDEDDACRLACDARFPDGLPLHESFLLCSADKCLGRAADGSPSAP
ncbi:MAG: hypothetical protein AAF928_07380 [Myxococcota bacterium]